MRGLERELLATIACLIAFYGVGLPLEIVFGYIEDMQALGLWIGFTVGLGVLFVFYIVAISCTDWDKKIAEAKERLDSDQKSLAKSHEE